MKSLHLSTALALGIGLAAASVPAAAQDQAEGGLSNMVMQHCFGALDANADQALAWDEVQTGLGESVQGDAATDLQTQFEAASGGADGTLDSAAFASLFGSGPDGQGAVINTGLPTAILTQCFGALDANADQALGWDEVQTGLGEGAQGEDFQGEFDAAAGGAGGTLNMEGFTGMFGADDGQGG